jgi:hypothetical protein
MYIHLQPAIAAGSLVLEKQAVETWFLAKKGLAVRAK